MIDLTFCLDVQQALKTAMKLGTKSHETLTDARTRPKDTEMAPTNHERKVPMEICIGCSGPPFPGHHLAPSWPQEGPKRPTNGSGEPPDGTKTAVKRHNVTIPENIKHHRTTNKFFMILTPVAKNKTSTFEAFYWALMQK